MQSNQRISSQEVQDGLSSLSPPTVTTYGAGDLEAELNIANSDLLLFQRFDLIKTDVRNTRNLRRAMQLFNWITRTWIHGSFRGVKS